MIPWVTVRPALVDLIASIAHEATLIPQWAHRAQVAESPTLQQSIFMRVGSVLPEGQDQEDYEDQDGELYSSVSGHRLITLEIKCDSFAELDGQWSFQTAERIRTRLGLQKNRDTLLALNLSLVETRPAIDAAYRKEGRWRNAAIFEAVLRCTFNDVAADRTDHWTQVELTSDIKTAEGTSVPTPPNFADQQVPE